jgi:multicomponent Na+:H+ antiporter subunit F
MTAPGGELIAVVTAICLVLQVVAAVLCVYRIATSDELANRIVALDLLLVIVVASVGIWTARTGTTAFLDVLVVGSLVVFIGSVLAARLLNRERSGR